MSAKPKYLITNLVYGQTYTKLFLENHLGSLLDETNLPAIFDTHDVEYRIFTDKDTVRELQTHHNMMRLSKVAKISSQLFQWPAQQGVKRFNFRYGLLLNMFKQTIEYALANGHDFVTAWVADLVVAKDFFPRILNRMEQGHGAVFVLPLRAASEAATPVLQQTPGALEDKALCALGLECLHPLWVACHWDNPQFTKLPFTMLWQGSGGVLARTFSTTPIVFKPTRAMLDTRGMIDGDIPALCENPYWCTDWTDAPVIGVEPLICYYPPFANRPSSAQLVADWSQCLHKTQLPFIEHRCYYPSKASVEMRPEVLEASDRAVREILERVGV